MGPRWRRTAARRCPRRSRLRERPRPPRTPPPRRVHGGILLDRTHGGVHQDSPPIGLPTTGIGGEDATGVAGPAPDQVTMNRPPPSPGNPRGEWSPVVYVSPGIPGRSHSARGPSRRPATRPPWHGHPCARGSSVDSLRERSFYRRGAQSQPRPRALSARARRRGPGRRPVRGSSRRPGPTRRPSRHRGRVPAVPRGARCGTG